MQALRQLAGHIAAFPRLRCLPARLYMCTGPKALFWASNRTHTGECSQWNKNWSTKLTCLLSLVFFLLPVRVFHSYPVPTLLFDVSPYFLKGSKDRKMRIIVFSWHFLGVYSVLWGLATGAFPSSVQIGELERLAVFTHGSLTPCSQSRILAHSFHGGNAAHRDNFKQENWELIRKTTI